MFILKFEDDNASYTLDTGVMFKTGLEAAERQVLRHLTSHYDEQIVEDFKEFFTDVKNAMSFGSKNELGLYYEYLDLDIKVHLFDKTLVFEDRSHDHLKIKVVDRYIDSRN